MPRAFVVSEVRTLTKVVAAFAVALLALGLWGSPAWAQDAELSITKEGPETVEPGQRFEYLLTVTNAEDAGDAAEVTVKDELPEGLTFIEFEANSPSTICDSPPPADTDGDGRIDVTCTVLGLAAGEEETITLVVRAPSRAGTISNRASATSLDAAPDSRAVSDVVTTRVIPDLVIRKFDDPDPVRREGLLAYTLRVTNQGAREVTNVVVIDDLPIDDVDFVGENPIRFSDEFDSCKEDGGLIRCEGSVGAGQTGTVQILVEPERAGTIENTAEVRAGRLLVDEATVETTVEGDEETTDEETTEETTEGTTEATAEGTIEQKNAGEETTVIDGQTIIIPKDVLGDELPDTGGPTGGGFLLAAGCALLGMGLIVNRIFR